MAHKCQKSEYKQIRVTICFKSIQNSFGSHISPMRCTSDIPSSNDLAHLQRRCRHHPVKSSLQNRSWIAGRSLRQSSVAVRTWLHPLMNSWHSRLSSDLFRDSSGGAGSSWKETIKVRPRPKKFRAFLPHGSK